MKAELDNVLETLKSNKLRVTNARKAVAEILIRSKSKFLSADEIFQKIEKSKKFSSDPVTVYRVLETFLDLKIISQSNFQGEASRYQFNDESADKTSLDHKHYFKCKSCKKIEPFAECIVARKEKELESQGYTALSHHLEITGICPACNKK